jgi:hypothetical protein
MGIKRGIRPHLTRKKFAQGLFMGIKQEAWAGPNKNPER